MWSCYDFSLDSVSALLFHPYDIICVIRDTFHLRFNPLLFCFTLELWNTRSRFITPLLLFHVCFSSWSSLTLHSLLQFAYCSLYLAACSQALWTVYKVMYVRWLRTSSFSSITSRILLILYHNTHPCDIVFIALLPRRRSAYQLYFYLVTGTSLSGHYACFSRSSTRPL